MISVEPFKAGHIMAMDLQPIQQRMRAHVTEEGLRTLEGTDAYTAFNEYGVPVASGGIMPYWEGRALAWAYLARGAGRDMVRLTRAARRLIDMAPYHRIELAVECDFDQGHRWARLLGFTMETPTMRKYTPLGGDATMYTLVR